MALRIRVLMAATAITVVGAVLAAAIGSWVVLRGFGDLEQAAAERDLERAEAALDAELATLASLAGDWSAWDDTHAFVTGDPSSQDYLDSNMATGTFVGLGLNLIVLTDRAGEVRYAGAVDLASEQYADPAPLVRRLRTDGLLQPFEDVGGARTGLLRVGDRLLALSIRPITDSEEAAAPAGTFAMARWMGDDVIAGLAERTRLDVALDTEAAQITGVELRTSPGTITAARTLSGITGQPVAELSITEPRSVLAQGRTSVRTLVLVVVGMLAVAGLLVMVVADRQVLQRLRRLGREIEDVGRQRQEQGQEQGQGHAARVTTDGTGDEIDDVATALNASLAVLERTRQDLQLRNSELEQANAELESANRELDTANQARRRFLSAVSHDLRAPLTSIDGFATLLRARWDDLPAEQRQHFLERIEASTATMEAMVQDLLMLSRLEEGVLEGEPTRLEMASFLPEVVGDMAVAGVAVTDAAGVVEADPDHLRRVLSNLIDNASKYGAPPIEVSAAVVDDTVELRVRDHGPGIEEDFEAALFGAFSQARPGRGADGGVGLGLSIVQHLTVQHGGTVHHDRQVSPGACFVVRLPQVADSTELGAVGASPAR